MNHLVFDTETTGFVRKDIPLDHKDQARMVQLGCLLLDDELNECGAFSCLIYPDNWQITEGAKAVHGISMEDCEDKGLPVKSVMEIFDSFAAIADVIVAHNYKFDREIVEIERLLKGQPLLCPKNTFCTMEATTPVCKLSGKIPGKYKWPKLKEAYKYLFNEDLVDAHDALIDCRACARIYKSLMQQCPISQK